jgi:hypothetical protein
MENLTALALAVVVSLTFSCIVAVVITKPLGTILRHLCVEGNASAFWVVVHQCNALCHAAVVRGAVRERAQS